MVQSRYLRTAASLSPASGSVIAARPPNGQLGGKLGLDIHSSVGAFLFSQPKRDTRTRGRKKAFVQPIIFPWSGWSSSFRGTEVRDEGEEASTSPPVRHPTTAVQENGTYGGQGKGAGAVQRLCCVNSAFLCSRSHRAKKIRDQMRLRLISKRPVIVPHTAKGENFGLDLLGRRGLLLWTNANHGMRYARADSLTHSSRRPADATRGPRRDQHGTT
jgi:hypothetical protein